MLRRGDLAAREFFCIFVALPDVVAEEAGEGFLRMIFFRNGSY